MLNVKNNFMYIKKNMSWVENKIYLVRTYLQQVQASVHVFLIPPTSPNEEVNLTVSYHELAFQFKEKKTPKQL